MLSAVNGGGLTIAVGCAISALCIGLVAAFGIAILHTFERSAPAPLVRSIAPQLTAEQIRLDTASIFPTRPYRLCRPQLQYLIAICRSVRHNHSQPLLYVFPKSIYTFANSIMNLSKCFCTFMTCCMARSPSQIGIADPDTQTQPFSHFSSLSPSASPPSERTSTSIIPPTRVNDSLS